MSWTGFNWTDQHPRFMADVTGDGRADIVGLGRDGVWVSLNSRGDGIMQIPRLALRDPSDYDEIRATVADIKTRRDAAIYMDDVAKRMAARRQQPMTSDRKA